MASSNLPSSNVSGKPVEKKIIVNASTEVDGSGSDQNSKSQASSPQKFQNGHVTTGGGAGNYDRMIRFARSSQNSTNLPASIGLAQRRVVYPPSRACHSPSTSYYAHATSNGRPYEQNHSPRVQLAQNMWQPQKGQLQANTRSPVWTSTNGINKNTSQQASFVTSHVDPQHLAQLRASSARSALLALFVVFCTAGLMSILSLIQIIALSVNGERVLSSMSTRFDFVHDVSSSLACVSLTSSLCALFLCSLQLVVCLNSRSTHHSTVVRILKFLEHGAYLRFIAIAGLYLTTPLLLISWSDGDGVLLSAYVFGGHFGSYLTSSVFTVVAAAGCLLCALSVLHVAYAWVWGALAMDPALNYEAKHHDHSNSTTLEHSTQHIQTNTPNAHGQQLYARAHYDDRSLSTLV